MDDSYELVPYKDILELKKDIDELKKGGNIQLQESMRNLNSLLNELIAIIKEAAKGMSDGGEGSLREISQKLDAIISQNEKIAEGLVTIADMIENNKTEKSKMSFPQPLMQQSPIMPEPMPISPMPSMPPPNMDSEQIRRMPSMDDFNFNLPPPSSGMPSFPEPKKKGLFGRFRK